MFKGGGKKRASSKSASSGAAKRSTKNLAKAAQRSDSNLYNFMGGGLCRNNYCSYTFCFSQVWGILLSPNTGCIWRPKNYSMNSCWIQLLAIAIIIAFGNACKYSYLYPLVDCSLLLDYSILFYQAVQVFTSSFLLWLVKMFFIITASFSFFMFRVFEND